MKRALVLTTESARHPFRQSLPPTALRLAEEEDGLPQEEESALSFFIGCFLMAFVAIYGMIA